MIRRIVGRGAGAGNGVGSAGVDASKDALTAARNGEAVWTVGVHPEHGCASHIVKRRPSVFGRKRAGQQGFQLERRNLRSDRQPW